MTEREEYIQQTTDAIRDVLRSIHAHLDECEDLFAIVANLQEDLRIWDSDAYGEMIKTHLSALPQETQNAIGKAKNRFHAARRREAEEKRQNEQAAERRRQETAIIRKQRSPNK